MPPPESVGVTSTARLQTWHADDDSILIVFAEPIAPEQEASVTVAYSASPRRASISAPPSRATCRAIPTSSARGRSRGAALVPLPGRPERQVDFRGHLPRALRDDGGLQRPAGGPDQGLEDGSGGLSLSQEKPHANYLITWWRDTSRNSRPNTAASPWRFTRPRRKPPRPPLFPVHRGHHGVF